MYTYILNIKQTLLMSPSLQASTSDLSLSAVPAEEAAEAEPEVGAPPPGPVPAPPPVAPPGAGFNTVVTDLLLDFQTCPKSQTCCRLALIYDRIVIDF